MLKRLHRLTVHGDTPLGQIVADVHRRALSRRTTQMRTRISTRAGAAVVAKALAKNVRQVVAGVHDAMPWRQISVRPHAKRSVVCVTYWICRCCRRIARRPADFAAIATVDGVPKVAPIHGGCTPWTPHEHKERDAMIARLHGPADVPAHLEARRSHIVETAKVSIEILSVPPCAGPCRLPEVPAYRACASPRYVL